MVDDDKAILDSFRDLLVPRYRVDTAQTGREAIDKSKASFYDIVIIDIKLPDMEGTELLAKLHDSSPKSKKLMITGYPTIENAVTSVNLKANAYLVKPVKPGDFLFVVDEKIRELSNEERVTEEQVMNWVETQYLKVKAKHRQTSK